MAVGTEQRFTSKRPCPICRGFDRAERGKGVRCWGFLSKDGKTAHCTSSEHSGDLPVNTSSETYAHRLVGSCKCGIRHDPNPDQQPVARAPRGEIEVTYDYRDEQGNLLFQAIRMRPKAFKQRRPDGKGGWLWKLSNTRRVLYKLPELLAADLKETVFLVEGEKDVELLFALGATATTNPQGALKWREEYSSPLSGRHIVIIPDNDPVNDTKPAESLKGQKHAMLVARSVHRVAASVKVLELPGLPPRGDVSDWFDAGGILDKLYKLTRQVRPYGPDNPYLPGGHTNGHGDASSIGEGEIIWSERESRHRSWSRKFIQQGLLQNGSFINGDGRFYYFDDATRTLCELESIDMRALLNNQYEINKAENIFGFLMEDLEVEVHTRGRRAQVSAFAHYDPENNLMFVDLGNGRMLKLDGASVEEVDNGTNGVLFAPTPISEPWTWIPDDQGKYIGDILIRSMNFAAGEGSPHSPDQQQLLLLVWLLSIAFESVQPTKPLAVALGPAGSGKSSMFRRIGRMFYGPNFEIDGIRKDSEGDFFVATTNNPFCAFDNVDRYIPWLEDALATSATGMKITKRVLYETNRAISYIPRAFIALTARTPHFRRDDVSERMIPFRLERLQEKVPEYQLLRQVVDQRDLLMSEYVRLLNRVIAVTESPPWDAELRLADFGSIAMRIGKALDAADRVADILTALQTSQQMFATEESDLYFLLDLWIRTQTRPGTLPGIEVSNDGRAVSTKDLFAELQGIAESNGYKWNIGTPSVLSRQLNALENPLLVHFNVEKGRSKNNNWWRFQAREATNPDDPFGLDYENT